MTEGYEKACELAVAEVKRISSVLDIEKNDHENLKKCAMTALGSKIVNKYQDKLANVAVRAVLQVADLERKDVNFDLIKVTGKTGGSIADTCYINGIILDKSWSHMQMQTRVEGAKICILTCPFEPPKPKTKHVMQIKSAEDYKKLYQYEQEYFKTMVKQVKDSGTNVVLCQWGFDDEANHLLMQNNLPAVRWVGGIEIELIALATGARIIPRFSEITPEKLGKADVVKEVVFGTGEDRMLFIEGCKNSKSITVLVRGGSTQIVDEARRCLNDAACVVRNLIVDPTIVPGGAATEIACSLCLNAAADQISTTEQYAVRGFAEALDQIPYSLADNSGYSPIDYVGTVKARQFKEKNYNLGIDCMRKVTILIYLIIYRVH